jgi:hypothetical protein
MSEQKIEVINTDTQLADVQLDVQPVNVEAHVEVPVNIKSPTGVQFTSPRPIVVKQSANIKVVEDDIALLMQKIKDVLNGHPLDKSNIIRVVFTIFSTANTMTSLTPAARQAVITDALENIIKQEVNDPTEQMELLTMVELIIPDVINICAEVRDKLLILKSDIKKCCVIV